MKTFCERTHLPGHPLTQDYIAIRQQLDQELLRCARCGTGRSILQLIVVESVALLICTHCQDTLQ